MKVPHEMVKVMYRVIRLSIESHIISEVKDEASTISREKLTERAIDPFFRSCSANLFEPDPVDVDVDVVDDVRC